MKQNHGKIIIKAESIQLTYQIQKQYKLQVESSRPITLAGPCDYIALRIGRLQI